MSEPSPLSLIIDRQDRLEAELNDLRKEVAEIPVLRKEVGLLREVANRNTTALYQGAGGLLVTGVLGVLTALILKGVIG